MATYNVTSVVTTTDGYLTRSATVNALVDADTYVFPLEQDYVKIVNNSTAYDIHLNIGKYYNLTVHPQQTFEADVDFTSFNVYGDGTASFTYTTKEYNDTTLTIDDLWDKMAIRDLTESGDMILASTDATTSAGTINTAIAGVNKKYTKTISVELQNTATTKHAWFNGNFAVSVDVTSTAGIATLTSEYLTLSAGAGTITLELTGTWAEADEIDVTITGGTQYGYAIADEVNNDTLAA